MAFLKTHAVVLKKMRLNEADNILTVLTPEGSKLSAIAKGIRKTKSRFAGRLEPFSVVELILYEGKTLYTVTSANVVKDNGYLREYDNFITASAMADLINQATFEKGNDSFLYDIFIETLGLLKIIEDKKWLLMVFDWKVLQALGYTPNFGNICNCKNPNLLDLSGEGLVCQNCKSPDRQYVSITPSILNALKDIINNELRVAIKITNDNFKQLQNITQKYMNYQLDVTLKSRRTIEG